MDSARGRFARHGQRHRDCGAAWPKDGGGLHSPAKAWHPQFLLAAALRETAQFSASITSRNRNEQQWPFGGHRIYAVMPGHLDDFECDGLAVSCSSTAVCLRMRLAEC